jgi:hypothetical protein
VARTCPGLLSFGPYGAEPGFVPGAGGAGFFDGLDAPRLMSAIFSTFFMLAPSPIDLSLSFCYYCAGADFGRVGGAGTGPAGGWAVVWPFRMETTAGGSGLSALASSRLTCHICVSFSTSL